MAIKPWYKVVTPREDLRENKPLDASEFAVHLDQVREGKGRRVYQNPQEFFERTFPTKSLGMLAAEVVRRLSGNQVGTSPVFNLSTQFGGGKTHALLLLYHLAKGGPEARAWKGVPAILEAAGVSDVPACNVGVFVGNAFDSITGRGGKEGVPLRTTPWGELAYQLGGAEGFAVVAQHDKDHTAPGGDVIERMIPADKPALLLLDELMNYASRVRKSGLGNDFYHFLHNLSEVAAARENVVLAVSIPASELEMTAEDRSDFERLQKLLDRVGKAIVMSGEGETSEIIRRRLFEGEIVPPDAKPTLDEYARWLQDHRDELPTWFPVDRAYATLASTYPFHPVVLSVFERKWRALPRFQQTRGVLRLLALWVSRAYYDGFKGAHKDPLIGLGTAPLDDMLFRRAVFEQIGEERLEAAVTTDVTGGVGAHAVRLDAEAPDAVSKARLHRKVATAIFFESNGGQQKGEATEPEIRLAVGGPGMDLASVNDCVEALTDACYYLHAENKRYRFAFKANLNKLLADRRAGVDAKEIESHVKDAVKEVFEKGDGIQRVFFPDTSGAIPDAAELTLVVMAPEHALRETGTQGVLGTLLREHGQSSRIYKSAILLAVPEDASTLREEARKYLAWKSILNEAQTLGLDEAQKKVLKGNVATAQSHLTEAVWRAYKDVYLLADKDKLERVDLGQITSSSAGSMVELILDKLQHVDVLTDKVKVSEVVDNWPPALPEWSTKAVRDAFYQSPKLSRLKSPEAVKATIAAGVKEGKIAYAGKKGEKYEPFLFKKEMAVADVEIRSDRVILRREDAERVQEALDKGEDAKPPTIPPPPSSKKPPPTTPPPPPPKPLRGIRWEGEVPWQKWSQLYNRVVAKVSGKGVKLRVSIEATPAGGLSEQEAQEVRAALKELGLHDGVVKLTEEDK